MKKESVATTNAAPHMSFANVQSQSYSTNVKKVYPILLTSNEKLHPITDTLNNLWVYCCIHIAHAIPCS